MSNGESVLDSVGALGRYFLGDATLGETLERLTELAQRSIGPSDEVGVTLLVEGRPGTHVATDPTVSEIDRVQYEADDGPALQALRDGVPALVRSTTRPERHPAFCAAAAGHGICSVLSLPIEMGGGRIGAMTHLSRTEDAFGPDDIELGTRFAQQLAFLLANAQAYWDAVTLAENLTQAMGTRAEIEQAKGIIMARSQVGPDDAFELLRQQSQAENRKIHDIAAELVRLAHQRPPAAG
jgi:GAF domain-containing protein